MCKLQNINDNPFARFSAEEEEDLKSIFYKPRYYDALKSNAKQGNSRILVGQRGLGKSATIHMLFEDLKANKTLPLLITRYDGIPLSNNKGFFLYMIIQSLTKRIAEHLYKRPKDSKKLTKEQKNNLAFLIELFYDEEISEEYLKQARTIKSKKFTNLIRGLFNKHLHIINGVANGAIKITSSIIRQSLGLPEGDSDSLPMNYFDEIPLSKINSLSMTDVVEKGNEKLLSIIKMLINISSSLGYDSIVVLFDKIDESEDLFSIRDISIDMDVSEELTFTGSKELTSLALGAFISNAVMYSKDGSTIKIDAKRQDDNVVTYIENTNAHIDEEDVPHLFEAFYRADRSRSRKSGGSGLGLYLAKLIITKQGGSCSIENKENNVLATMILPST